VWGWVNEKCSHSLGTRVLILEEGCYKYGMRKAKKDMGRLDRN
jgi:hypothetical protein